MADRTIWKINIEVVDEQDVLLPVRSEFLHAGIQAHAPLTNQIQTWWLVDPETEQKPRTLLVRGTGHRVDAPLVAHLATVIDDRIQAVWHIFDKGPDWA